MGLLLVLWGVAVLVMTAQGARHAQAGASRLQAIEDSAGVRDLLSGSVTEELGHAHRELRRARRLLGSPVLAPARILPIAGRQLRAAHALASTAEAVVASASSVAAGIAPVPGDAPLPETAALAKVRRLRTDLVSVDTALADADLGPGTALVGPLHRARLELADSLRRAQRVVHDLDAVLAAVDRVLTGPSRYIVVAANNAEMRIGSGMFLSIGSIEIVDGTMRVDRPFTPAGELVLTDRVPLPPEIEERWGWSGAGADWRSLGLSARFPVNAGIGAEMWSRVSPDPVDGVFAVDVAGLRSILQITGPVDVDGELLGAADVIDLLLRRQYEDADIDEANAARRDRLSALGTATLGALGGAPLDLVSLLEAFGPARDGRHLMAWSNDPEVQRAWRLLNVDGELGPHSLLVGLANIDGSKLDPYLDLEVRASTHRSGPDVQVELTTHVANGAPDGLPDYVNGTDGSPAYRGLLSVHLPGGASEVEVSGLDAIVSSGPDGPTSVVAATVTVPQGATRTAIIRFSVPVGEDLDVEPSGRLPAVRWTESGREHFDDARWVLPLPRG